MLKIQDLSNTAIILIIIVALTGAFTVRAIVAITPAAPAEKGVAAQLVYPTDPNMAFTMLPNDVNVKVGDTFRVTISVINATKMFGWQIYVSYDPAKLECLKVSLPNDYLLSSYVTLSGYLTMYNATEWPSQQPLQKIRNDAGWVLAGDCQIGANQPTFNGSGTLCQIDFKALTLGPSTLALINDLSHDFQTFVVHPDITSSMSKAAPAAAYSNVYTTPRK